jgi:hypothetical protein
MGLQPVHRTFLDHEVDQRQPLALVIGRSQQPPVAIDIKSRILFPHATTPADQGQIMAQPAVARKVLSTEYE